MRTQGVAMVLAGCLTLLSACVSGDRIPREPVIEPEAYSLLGAPLYAPQLPEDVLLKRGAQLNIAHRAFLAAPQEESTAIWFGRRLAYLGRYHKAIEVFTQGLEHHPESYRLRRHRGHRHITLRQFDEAIDDLSTAATLITNVPDAIEPDGMPNARNIPRSTTHTNIYYHLGLAYYLRGDWEKSRAAYASCLEASPNDDMRVAASYWLFLSLTRLGLPQVADSVLDPIEVEMDVIENDGYQKLLLIFKGELEPASAVAIDEGDGVQDATLAYGLAVWSLLNDDREVATSRFQAIIDANSWAAFGHIAAEAELARLSK